MKLSYNTRLIAGASLTALLLVASPATVFAEHGKDGPVSSPTNTSQTSSSSSEHSGSSGTVSTGADSTNRQETEHTTVGTSTESTSTETQGKDDDSLHDRVQKLLDDKRQKGQERSEAVRQKACTNHETEIDDRFSTLGTRANKYLQSFNDIFSKLQVYQTSHQLTVANYDALVADVNVKQLDATNAVAALQALSGTKIDCTVTDPASTVATVKTAADDARTALQAYRASLKTLVNALLAAQPAAGANTSTDTSGTSTTEHTTTSGSN